MNSEQRAQLLRDRFRAIGGVPYVANGTRKPKPVAAPKPAKICLQWPEANRDTKRAGVWMHVADAKPDVAPRPERRQKGETALTRISRQLPMKLPVVAQLPIAVLPKSPKLPKL